MKRTFALLSLALTAAGLLWINKQYGDSIRAYWDHRFYPPVHVQSDAGMLKEIASVKLNHFSAKYARVKALVNEARRQGKDVSNLDEKLALSMQLAQEGRLSDAQMYLNIVELRIPRRQERLKGAGEGAD